jgi:hypothetical protein
MDSMPPSKASPAHSHANGTALIAVWVIAGLFLPLVFQDIRLEGYETEKAGVLWMLGAPLMIILPALMRRRMWTQPLTWTAAALIVAAGVSASASISPQTGLYGLIGRGQGILTHLAYGALFMGAAAAGWRVRQALMPALIAVSVPLCLYALYQRFDVGNERPGSLAGNANFLASWLILALILLTAHFPRSREKRIAHTAVIGLGAVTLFLTQSRGALAGLAVGLLAAGLAWCALTARRKLALGLIALSAAGALIYLAAGALIPEMAQSGALRILRPVDVFRLEAWNAGWQLIAEQDAPLMDAFGRADSLAALRLWIGYGLDTTPFLQSRFGIVALPSYLIDTFHTLALDALTWTGMIGLALWVSVYLAGIGMAIKALRLMHFASFLAAHLFGAAAGSAGMALLLSERVLDARVLALIGALLGLPLGTLVYLGWRAARAKHPCSVDPIMTAVVGVIAAHWVDLQFGFGTAAASALWWICLGIAVSRKGSARVDEDRTGWAAITSAGVILIAGIGLTMGSQYVYHEVGTPTLPYLLMALVIIGALNWRRSLDGILLCAIVWAAWFAVEAVIVGEVGRAVDASLTDAEAPFGDSVRRLALKGILMILIIVGVWGISRWTQLLTVIAMLAGFAAGALLYQESLKDSVQFAIANSYAQAPDPAAHGLALRLYSELERSDAVFAALQAQVRWFEQPLYSRLVDALLRHERHFTGRRDWALFYDSYVERFRQPPSYAVDVIRNGAFVDGFSRWAAWADADVRETNGRARFVDTGQNPALRGAIYQLTGIRASAGTGFEARARFTNPSSQSQNVQIFVHAADWSEAHSCAFTLAPSEMLDVIMTTRSERAWEDVQVSIYLDEGGEITVRRVSLRLSPLEDGDLPDSQRQCSAR